MRERRKLKNGMGRKREEKNSFVISENGVNLFSLLTRSIWVALDCSVCLPSLSTAVAELNGQLAPHHSLHSTTNYH